ncbi:hypothetical protein E5288_WYG003359 [Bos mutus]|uniref:Uncharacterized protein n=1 Tax=Bos mutus TaxID=72004 RepID=A0A6B0RFC0_9CETA|nr:hypothetical protein [Bos mutus]
MAFKCSSNTLAASRVGGGGGGWNPAGLGPQLREKGKNRSGLWSTKLPAFSTASVVEGCGTADWLIALLARPSEIAILARYPQDPKLCHTSSSGCVPFGDSPGFPSFSTTAVNFKAFRPPPWHSQLFLFTLPSLEMHLTLALV